MNINDLQPGQEVTINVKSGEKNGSFKAKVAMTYNNYLMLEPMYVRGKMVGFPSSFQISLSSTTEGVFQEWSGLKIRTVAYKGKNYHAVELVGDAEIRNWRNNYRVYIGRLMTVVFFSDKGQKTINAVVKDISETGFAFITRENFDVGRAVRLNVILPSNETLPMAGKIVRKVPAERAGETLYGCHFGEKNQKLNNWLMLIQRDKQKKKIGK